MRIFVVQNKLKKYIISKHQREFLRMERDRLLYAVREYCLNNRYPKTAKKIKTLPLKVGNTESIENVFDKYFKNENKPKTGLGFSIKLPTGLMDLRKRIRDVDITEEKVKAKKPKKENSKVKKEKSSKKDEEIPEQFLILLDELRLNRKDAKLLFENREHWAYVKSDRQIFCVEQGMVFLRCKIFSNHHLKIGCNFSTTMGPDCLSEHCQNKHNWRKIPCPYDYCKFEAYNSYTHKAGSINAFFPWPQAFKNYILKMGKVMGKSFVIKFPTFSVFFDIYFRKF